MKMKKIAAFIISFLIIGNSLYAQETVNWVLNDILDSPCENAIILGNPETTPSPYGDAVLFNGTSDGILIDYSPLKQLSNFTLEAIIRPDAGGPAAQRFLHMGENNAERVMFETRLTENGYWYLDAYIESGATKLIMIDSTKLHKLGEWVNFTMVNKAGSIEVFINGKSEFKETISFAPFKGGQTSVGVRQNKVYWYKGAIYRIRITPKSLSPEEFL